MTFVFMDDELMESNMSGFPKFPWGWYHVAATGEYFRVIKDSRVFECTRGYEGFLSSLLQDGALIVKEQELPEVTP